MKIFSLLSLSAFALLLSSCGGKEQQEQEVPMVRLSKVEEASGIRTNTYPGKTQAANSSAVAFRVSGTLESVPVKVGDHVRKGQVIARMDNRDYGVQLKATKAEYESTKSECERVMALYQDNSTSEINYDKARYGLEQITEKLQHAQDQYDDCVAYAPFDAYVQSIFHDAHETVAAGMPVVGLFASKGIEVVINIPAVEYMRSDSYDHFTATFDVKRDKTYELHLENIAQKANANQLYEMRLMLEDPEGEITPGMTTTVEISYKAEGNVPVEIPVSAVFADGDDDQSSVYVYDEQTSTIHKTPVTVSYLRSVGKMQVISGLKPGQLIVSAGVHHVVDGEKVTPAKEPSKTNVGGLL